MRQVQGIFFTGYVTIRIEGNYPEMFFQECAKKGITVWNIRKLSKDTCEGNIKLSDIHNVRVLMRGKPFKLRFVGKKGIPFLLHRFLGRKPLVISMILSILLALFLSNVLWKIEITGVPKDIEEKMVKQLDQYGIHAGSWIFSLEQPTTIQQKLVEDIPELLWVGVNRRGTTYYLEGVEKIVVKEEEKSGPRHLIASKKGVITNMYVAKGLPMVKVNDYVEKGDLLVSGQIGGNDVEGGEEEEEKKETKKDYVAAEGDIIAKTWYEVSVSSPLVYNYEELTGKKDNKYYLQFGEFRLPIWGFGTPDFNDIRYETNATEINFLKWTLPVKFVDTELSEKVFIEKERTKEEAIEKGIEQAKSELQLQLGPEAKIVSDKVLHQRMEHGKVELTLMFTVEENIAYVQPINQGD